MIYTDKFGITTGGTYDPTIYITGLTDTISSSSTDYELPTAAAVYNAAISGITDTQSFDDVLGVGDTTTGKSFHMWDSGLEMYYDFDIDSGRMKVGSTAEGWYAFLSAEEGLYLYASPTNIMSMNMNAIQYYDGSNSTTLNFPASPSQNNTINLPDASGTIITYDSNTNINLGQNNTITSGSYSTALGSGNTIDASYAFATGLHTVASGGASFAGGGAVNASYPIIADGQASFNFSSRNDASDDVSGATGDYSAILGGTDNSATHTHSVLIGCKGQKSEYDYSTGVEKLRIYGADNLNGDIIMTDVDTDLDYKLYISGGTLTIEAV